MLCAICDQDERVMQAIAVCRRCGAGACRAHVYMFCYAGAPSGMQGMSPPRREYVCHLCWRDIARKPGEQRLSGAASDVLPDARSLIQAVEALLVQQRQPLDSRPERRWQKRWQALWCRLLPMLAARR